ncbi:MAG: DUF6506 family protein [bacterium]
MAFNTVFIALNPEADPKKDMSVIKTSKYVLHSILVQNFQQAIDECKSIAANQIINSIILCPGFTHKQVAAVFEAFETKVAVCIARADGPSSKIALDALVKEGIAN